MSFLLHPEINDGIDMVTVNVDIVKTDCPISVFLNAIECDSK